MAQLGSIEKQCVTLQARLSKEIEASGRRANTNLVIGMITSIIGLCLLGGFVITSAPEIPPGTKIRDAIPVMLVGFVPRLSLVIVIEVFAYFFLRLYKSGLSEIKYFQNELTNVEMRALALASAVRSDTPAVVAALLKDIVKTERNFILKKGETTVDLRRDEMDATEAGSILAAVRSTIKEVLAGGKKP